MQALVIRDQMFDFMGTNGLPVDAAFYAEKDAEKLQLLTIAEDFSSGTRFRVKPSAVLVDASTGILRPILQVCLFWLPSAHFGPECHIDPVWPRLYLSPPMGS